MLSMQQMDIVVRKPDFVACKKKMKRGGPWLGGRVHDSGLINYGLESNQRHCFVSLSKALYPLLSTGQTRQTQED